MSRGLAARVLGWQRRMGAVAGPVGPSGEQSDSRAVVVELWVDGAWVDITSLVLVRDDSGHISLAWGRRDEGAVTEQSTAGLQLNNRDGRFSPRNPRSPYSGLLGRNQPLRTSVPGPTGGKAYRSRTEISSWPQRWDTTGRDVWVDADAAGILRRLAQGAVPDHSVIREALTEQALLAYWPCEDPTGSTSIASALVNGSDAVIDGTPTLAAYSGFGASDPLPTMTGATITGGVANYTPAPAAQVRFLLAVPAAGLPDGRVICTISHPSLDVAGWELRYNVGGGLTLHAFDGDGATLAGAVDTPFGDVRGKRLRVSIELQQNGPSVNCAVRYLDLATGGVEASTATFGWTMVRVNRIALGPLPALGPAIRGLTGTAVGHLTLQTEITPLTDLGIRVEPSGEVAGRRIQRLCAETGLAFEWVGDLDDTPAMGGQQRAKPLDLLRECELADGGMLYESLGAVGLGYRTRASLYNQDPALVLDYPAGLLADVPSPVDDDQLTRNLITVTSGDVSETAELADGPMSTQPPPAGIGVYGDPVTLNLTPGADLSARLLDQAGWRLHLGTVDEARYPQISIELRHPRITPEIRAAVLGLRQGDRIQIINPPDHLPPDAIDQIVLGGSETVSNFLHRVTLTCAPASPYRVAVADTAWTALDTDRTVLATAIGTSDTTLRLAPTVGETGWTTDPADYPLVLRAGGETMTATACTGLVVDSFTRSLASTWGTADTGQPWSEQGGAASDRSVNGTAGVITLSSPVDTTRRQLAVDGVADCEVLVSIAPGQVSTGASLVPGILLRHASGTAFYRCRLHFRTDSAVYLVVTTASGDVGAQVNTGLTYTANQAFWLRARVDGHRIRGRVWPAGEGEPTDWGIDRTVTSGLISEGSVGLAAGALTGLTNPSPTAAFDSFTIVSPQAMTVTRSTNSISKSHPAGTDVRLASPTVIAL